MVDEDQLGALREPACLRDEATLEVRAAWADARVGRRGHLAPHRRRLGEPPHLGAVAGLAVRGPVVQLAHVVTLRRFGKLAPADVIRYALEHDRREWPREDRAQQRQIMARDLIL